MRRLMEACESSARWLEKWLERFAWLLLLAGGVLITWLSLAASSAKPFWFDEICTYYEARLPDFATLLRALSQGVDLQPPLFFLSTAAAQKLFGASEVATRLPSLCGYLLLTLCLYLFVRRRTNALYGMIAALFPAVTEAFRYSYEARPYALMLGFSALALLCWQHAASPATRFHRRLALGGLWLSLFLALSFHYYCTLVFVAIAVGEAVRVIQRRKLDIPVVLAMGLAGLLGIVYLPLIRGEVALHGNHPWNVVTPRLIFDAYQFALTPAVVPMAFCFVALCLLYWLDRAAQPEAAVGTGLTLAETGACLGFVLLPLFGFFMGRFVTHMMTPRYVFSLVIGFAVAFACGLYRAAGGRASGGLAFALILAGTFAARHVARPQMANEYAALRLPRQEGGLPLVMASSLEFAPQLFYGDPDVKSRVVCVDLATHYHGVDSVDRDVWVAEPFFHWPVMPYSQFTRAHPRFFLLATPGWNWIAEDLHAEGATLEIASGHDESTLYLVTLSRRLQ